MYHMEMNDRAILVLKSKFSWVGRTMHLLQGLQIIQRSHMSSALFRNDVFQQQIMLNTSNEMMIM